MVQLAHPTSAAALGRLYFHCALGFATQILAYTLDSLVRVSRRVKANHLTSIANLRVPKAEAGYQSSFPAIVQRRNIDTAETATFFHAFSYGEK